MNRHLLSIGSRAPQRVATLWLCYCLAGCLTFGPAGVVDAQGPPGIAARVGVAKVQRRRLDTGQTFVGTVMPLRKSTVASAVEGLVDELLVREGDEVKQGQTLLAKLRDRQLKIQEAAAAAELQVLTSAHAQLIKSLPAEIDQAHARMKVAEALKAFTSARLERSRELIKRKAIAEDELEEVVSTALAGQEKYRETKLAWELATAVREDKLHQAAARVAAQRQQLLRLQDEISEHTIEAPFDGYVTREHTEVGQWIAKGGPVVEIVQLDRVRVEVSVPETYLPQVREGMRATITIGALPGELWQAPVSAIVPQADLQSRSFPVKIELKNRRVESKDRSGPDDVLLKAGMFARVTLPVGSKANALLVPKDALVLGRGSPLVFVVDPMPQSRSAGGPPSKAGQAPGGPPPGPAPDGVARPVPIELGTATEDLIEVRGPLKPGELVIVEGNERMFPGQPVSIVKSGRPATKAPAGNPTK